MGVSGVWGRGEALRSSSGAGLAAPGHLSVPYEPARPTTARRVSAAWGAGGEAALGGTFQPVHGAVRGFGHRVVERGKPEGGRRAVGVELGRDSRLDGAGGEERVAAPRG